MFFGSSYENGVHYEKVACDILIKNGYEILRTRYKTTYGEIDIIAQKSDIITFFEVKKRKSIVDAKYSISQRQRERMKNAILYFLSTNYNSIEIKIEVHAVLFDSSDFCQMVYNILDE